MNLNDDHLVAGGCHSNENLSVHLWLLGWKEQIYESMEDDFFFLTKNSYLILQSALVALRILECPPHLVKTWVLGNRYIYSLGQHSVVKLVMYEKYKPPTNLASVYTKKLGCSSDDSLFTSN